MTKDEAQAEAVRRWRELPAAERQHFDQAQVFAASLAEELDFRTMGNARKVIAAWLVRDLAAGEGAEVSLEARHEQDEAESEHGDGAD